MKVNEDWSIEQDAYNIILVKHGVSDEKEVGGKIVGGNQTESRSYYPTLEKACLGLQRKSIDTESLETILSTIKQSTQDIIEICKTVSKEKV